MWQNEFESWGREKDFTDAMWKSQAVLDCAIREVAGSEAFPSFARLINHKGWTDGGAELGLDYYLPTRGRKNDTLYDIAEFRTRADALWTASGQVTLPSVSVKNVQPGNRHRDVKRVRKALLSEGLLRGGFGLSNHFGPRMQRAYREWQLKCGFTGADADGIPGFQSLSILGSKHGFTVVK